MPLEPEQVQVRDLVMGPGTDYIVTAFNPWNRQAKVAGEGPNPWGHGGYSGAEWLDVTVVNFGIHTVGTSSTDWLIKHRALDQAFAPVETGADIELRFAIGADEYLMWGRPRMLNPQIQNIRSGEITTSASFVCLDPLIYSAELHEATIELPYWVGGIEVPIDVEAGVGIEVPSTLVGGHAEVTNDGDRNARVLLRFNGPVRRPFVTIAGATLTLDLDIPEGDWVDVDTHLQTVLLNGTASRLSSAHGTWPILPPGTHTVRYGARSAHHPDATLIVRWRDTY